MPGGNPDGGQWTDEGGGSQVALDDWALPFFLGRYAEAYRSELAAFVAAVSDGKSISPTGEDGPKAQRIADAATKADRTGRPVKRQTSALARTDWLGLVTQSTGSEVPVAREAEAVAPPGVVQSLIILVLKIDADLRVHGKFHAATEGSEGIAALLILIAYCAIE